MMSRALTKAIRIALPQALSGTNGSTGLMTSKCYSGCSDICGGKKLMDLKCKTALITGGNSGIGLAIADSFLRCGLQKAIIGGTNCEKGMKAMNYLNSRHGAGKAEFRAINVSDNKQFEDAFKDIIHREGSIDILVNNAGMLAESMWEKTIDINIKGVYRGILLAHKYMPRQKNKGGCVVNVSSILGFDPFPYVPCYNATKHAVIGLTKSFGTSGHFARTGIRQIALCPGVTTTPLIKGAHGPPYNREWGQKTVEGLASFPVQTTRAVGEGTVYMVQYGPPGSLWVVEGSKLQLVMPPKRQTYQTKVMDL